MERNLQNRNNRPFFPTRSCTKNGEAIDLAAYEYYHSQFFKENADCGYTAAGAFVWENKAFDNSYDGFLAMAEAALALYVPVAE